MNESVFAFTLARYVMNQLKRPAARLVFSSRPGSNWPWRVFVWVSVGDSYTLQDTWRDLLNMQDQQPVVFVKPDQKLQD